MWNGAMEDIKATLRQELKEVESELENLDDLLKERGEYGYGRGDPAVYQWEFNLALRERYRERREQIAYALQRIEEGRYGVCGECGGEIEPARLEALPFTSLCIECARRRK